MNPSSLKQPKIFYLFGLLLLMYCTFLLHNGTLPANLMEARNLISAREMVADHNWLNPTLNGELRLEKPPLPTWISALNLKIIGEQDLGLLRLPAALMAMLLIFFLFRMTRALTADPLLPWIAAATAATSFYIFFLARDISWDMFCHSFMMGAIWQLHKAITTKKLSLSAYCWSALLMGLSFLSKGPVAFYALLLPFLLVLYITRKETTLYFHGKGFLLLVTITLMVSMPWTLWIYYAHPEQTVAMAERESSAWVSREMKPPWHYWSFPAQSGVWLLPAILSLALPFVRKREETDPGYRKVVLWSLLAVALLSIVPEKKERYLFPVLIPLAISTAWYFRLLSQAFQKGTERRVDRLFLFVNGTIVGFAAFAAPLLICYPVRSMGILLSWPSYLLIFLGFWSVSGLLLGSMIQRRPLQQWLGMVLLVAVVLTFLMKPLGQFATQNPEYKSYTSLQHDEQVNNLPFFYSGEKNGKLLEIFWEIGKKVNYLEPPGSSQLPALDAFVLISPKPPEEIYQNDATKGFEMSSIGRYDGAMRGRWGTAAFRNYVTIFRKKGVDLGHPQKP
ncbi:MAG: glycosyltransferase family 39 protein [Marinilabiliales bacterium]|nr:glycosyltransferase family 39 protein [Marinilabiliales bacterium]